MSELNDFAQKKLNKIAKLEAEVERLKNGLFSIDEAHERIKALQIQLSLANARADNAAAAHEENDSLRAKVSDLTAKLAAVEDGSAFVGGEYQTDDWIPANEVYWAKPWGKKGPYKLCKTSQGRRVHEDDNNERRRYTGPTTAPLPEPEQKPKPKKAGKYRCTRCGRDTFDKPSPHKCGRQYRKRGLSFEPVGDDPETEQPSICPACDNQARIMPCEQCGKKPEQPAKPKCLEDVPAVLCEVDGYLAWVDAAEDSFGDFRCVVVHRNGNHEWSQYKADELKPIHYAPDAAELAAKIRKGGE